MSVIEFQNLHRAYKRGQEVLKKNPSHIDMKFLEQFPEYLDFRDSRRKPVSSTQKTPTVPQDLEKRTPEEILEDAYQEIRDNVAQELLANVMSCTPSFFERLVVELLVNMGYGGSRKDAARAVGQTGDEGIDGIIDEDCDRGGSCIEALVGIPCDGSDSDKCKKGLWACEANSGNMICRETGDTEIEIPSNGKDDNCDGIIDEGSVLIDMDVISNDSNEAAVVVKYHNYNKDEQPRMLDIKLVFDPAVLSYSSIIEYEGLKRASKSLHAKVQTEHLSDVKKIT